MTDNFDAGFDGIVAASKLVAQFSAVEQSFASDRFASAQQVDPGSTDYLPNGWVMNDPSRIDYRMKRGVKKGLHLFDAGLRPVHAEMPAKVKLTANKPTKHEPKEFAASGDKYSTLKDQATKWSRSEERRVGKECRSRW